MNREGSSSDDPSQGGGFTTRSNFIRWWYCTFRGYQVELVRTQPTKTPMGRVRYLRKFVLRRAEEGEAG